MITNKVTKRSRSPIFKTKKIPVLKTVKKHSKSVGGKAKKVTKNHPILPKQPMTNFFIFNNENRAKIQADLGTNSIGDVAKEAKKRYDNLSAEDVEKITKIQAGLQTKYDLKMFNLDLKGHFSVSHESFPDIANSAQLLDLLKTKDNKQKI